MRHAFQRDVLKRSLIKATETSAIDTVEVSAATVSSRKNNIDHSCVKLILQNTSGRVTKTRVAPLRLSPARPNDVTAGKIIRPIMNATSKSSSETVIAVLVRLVFLG